MATIPERLKILRKEAKLTQADVAKFLNISESAYGYYEQGRNEISISNLKKLAKKYDVSIDYITCETNIRKPYSDKAEKDIAKRIQKFREEIENSDGLAFDGEPLSEEAKESLIESMEYIFRQTQKINKKYVPKKYREEDNE